MGKVGFREGGNSETKRGLTVPATDDLDGGEAVREAEWKHLCLEQEAKGPQSRCRAESDATAKGQGQMTVRRD